MSAFNTEHKQFLRSRYQVCSGELFENIQTMFTKDLRAMFAK